MKRNAGITHAFPNDAQLIELSNLLYSAAHENLHFIVCDCASLVCEAIRGQIKRTPGAEWCRVSIVRRKKSGQLLNSSGSRVPLQDPGRCHNWSRRPARSAHP
jgi:hypothetical protein